MVSTSLLIMAAGLGSRFGGEKQFVPFGPNGEAILDYSVYDAIESGFDRIIIVVRKSARAMMEMRYSELMEKYEIIICEQEEDSLPAFFDPPEDRVKPYGTAHALMCAAQFIDYPTLVINADDYYGKETLQRMSAFMNTMTESQTGLAVFPISKTLSDCGPVTRGICSLSQDGELISVRETDGIALNSDGVVRSGTGIPFSDNTPVSMNVWAVSPSFTTLAQPYFDRFFNELPENDLKSELPLPVMINSMIADGQLIVTAVPIDCDWYGITYRDDASKVREILSKLHSNGTYPSPLFK